MKKKLITILMIILCLSVALFITGCKKDKDNSGGNSTQSSSTGGGSVEPSQTPLGLPTSIRIEGTILKWSAVENASGYKIIFSTMVGKEYITEETYYDVFLLPLPESFSVQIKAIGDGASFIDSEWSRKEVKREFDIVEDKLIFTDRVSTYGYYTVKPKDKEIEGEVIIPDKYNGYPTKIGNFAGCKITKATIYCGEISEWSFSGCRELKEVILAADKTTLEKSAFWECVALETFTAKNIDYIKENVFYGCTNIKNISVGIIEECEQKVFDNTVWYATQPEGILTIGQNVYGFKGDMPSELKESDFPEGVTNIMRSAFLGSKYKNVLQKVSLPDGIDRIGTYSFYGNESLSYVKLPANLQILGASAFRGCSALTSIALPEGIKTIKNLAFASTGITELTLPGCIEELGGSAFTDSQIKKLTICEGIKEIPRWCFSYNKQLESVVLPASLEKIGSEAFSKCEALKSVTFTDSTGWTVSQENSINWTAVDVADPTVAASYLTDLHLDKIWQKGK